ncbi:MAG: hypothetical protein LKJ44_04805 [Bifidobacteriaceae bacterium]|nr:hypothetical protein [Bifidobacteriaceae bacterium]MCI1979018.1 hypothetical protein [Bifidobacteriaceae bacterium]
MSDNYHVLRPSSAGGCSIVVSYSAGLWDAGGYVYLMRSDSRALTDTGGSWSVSNDPGSDPIEEGTWSLRWNHETAQLNIWSTAPIGYFDWPKPIVCPE